MHLNPNQSIKKVEKEGAQEDQSPLIMVLVVKEGNVMLQCSHYGAETGGGGVGSWITDNGPVVQEDVVSCYNAGKCWCEILGFRGGLKNSPCDPRRFVFFYSTDVVDGRP